MSNSTEETTNIIVKEKRYVRPILLICKVCPHCLKWVDEFGNNLYCLVDDKYKDTINFKCPFKEQ